MLTSLLIQNAEIYAVGRSDLRCQNGVISAIAPHLTPLPTDLVFDANHNALLPGLHDHHIHLCALAAAQASVNCGPPQVNNPQELAIALQQQEQQQQGSKSIRGVQYHESVAGDLDRYQLDKIINHKPVRVQHRSGKLWMVNSLAADLLNLDAAEASAQAGIERDSNGKATGRLFRMDNWLREKLSALEGLDIAGVSRQLASFGVTGITDTTYSNGAEILQKFSQAIDRGELLQRVHLMGTLDLPPSQHPFIARSALKILLDEDRLPELTELEQWIQRAHQDNRGVAFHCVTPTELILALSALTAVGPHAADRIEHASLTPADSFPLLRATGVTVVTQPNFIRERGEQYLQNVANEEHAQLYRAKSLIDYGIPVGGSTDAPYGNPNPWLAMDAAVHRATPQGIILGEHEKLTPESALALFISHPETPGAGPRQLSVGANADFCILDRSWLVARTKLAEVSVVATVRAGEFIYK
jgi:predicted amidohydrolase YtcJ